MTIQMPSLLCAALVTLAASVGSAQAQGYPAKPARVIVPYVAGGAADIAGEPPANPVDNLVRRGVR